VKTWTPVYRVVNADDWTVAEYVVGRAAGDPAKKRALNHAARIGGKVFHVDEHGFLALIFKSR
jgi:hypothetical protein